jgi:hypothetical protein
MKRGPAPLEAVRRRVRVVLLDHAPQLSALLGVR